MATSKEQLEVTVREQQLEIERLRAEKNGLYLSPVHQDLWARKAGERPDTFRIVPAPASTATASPAPGLTDKSALEGALAEAQAALAAATAKPAKTE